MQTLSPEEQQHCLGERLEVVVPIDLVVISHGNFPKHLDEEVIKGEKKSDFCLYYSLDLECSPKVHVISSFVPKGSIVERYNFKRWGLMGGSQVAGGVPSQENVGR